MPIYIYNSLTRKKEEFKPLNPPQVKMYVCGPTVYDEPHIGHARSAYIFDVIRRYLEYKGYRIKFVRNVTDVDDKIIDKAKKEFGGEDLNKAVKKIAEKYLYAYHAALNKLGISFSIDAGIIEPKASEYIPKMIDFISLLINNGIAYQAGQDVYFDITKARDYGKLSNQSLEKMEAGSRVSPAENKKNPLDFALWKSAKENEPSWQSPWGKGRPGWHIECSVMSLDILGDEFDIHGGGIDLIFPHHENEIVQSEGAGKKFARIWIHHGLLTINGQKMAKSLGNFVTIDDIVKKYHEDVLKTFFLQALYSSPIDFTERKMQEETQRYKSFIWLFRKYKEFCAQDLKETLCIADKKKIDEYKEKFMKVMDDNFNTPEALSVLEQLKSYAYSLTVNNEIEKNWSKFQYSIEIIKDLLSNIFGLYPDKADPENDLRLANIALREVIAKALKDTVFINNRIEERAKLRKEGRYVESDAIKKELEKMGILLEDKKDGTTKWKWK